MPVQQGVMSTYQLTAHDHSGVGQGGAVDPSVINHDALLNFVLAEHLSLPNTLVNVLTDHNKVAHDALNIDADLIDGIHIPNTIANVLTNHTKAVHDALGVDADLIDGIHIPNTIANVLTNHTKAVHDALGINADTVDTYHLNQNVLTTSSPTFITPTVDSIRLMDTGGDHTLNLVLNEDMPGSRTLNFIVGGLSRAITLSGNPTLADWFDQGVKQASSPTFAGATINGKFNFGAPTELTIAAGVITVTKSYHRVDGEGDAADTLSTINGGVDGMILVIQSENAARDITVDEAGNIMLTGANCILTDPDCKLIIFYDGTNTKWVELGRCTG